MRKHILTLGLLTLAFPAFAYAALININTADATLLDTLPGIGPTYAARIVTYRTDHGPFARIEDIQNVSGIGPSTYATIAPLITVGEASTPATSTPATSTPSNTASAAASATTYTPPPSTLLVDVGGDRAALLEVPLRVSARVTTKSGTVDPSAVVSWSFGDGSSAQGSELEKTYHYAGTYLVVATVADGSTKARGEFTVTVAGTQVRLLPVSGDGITIVNDSENRLDLSSWRLLADTGSFRIPEGTVILPGSSVLFPFNITNLPIASAASLVYPDGVTAARSSSPQAAAAAAAIATSTEQPAAGEASYKEVQKVEPISSPKTIVQSHEEAVNAPAAAMELAAAGAALPAATSAAPKAHASGLFRSPWTFSLLGVVALAGGAFILL